MLLFLGQSRHISLLLVCSLALRSWRALVLLRHRCASEGLSSGWIRLSKVSEQQCRFGQEPYASGPHVFLWAACFFSASS